MSQSGKKHLARVPKREAYIEYGGQTTIEGVVLMDCGKVKSLQPLTKNVNGVRVISKNDQQVYRFYPSRVSASEIL